MQRMEIFYSGRVIFDHLAKTAGQAVNDALRLRLGEGCVTENLIGEHRSLIRQYGGLFPIISGHISFVEHRRGLDPRYNYITLLRNPIDRAISWLYFITNNHTSSQLPGLYESAQLFLDSEGQIDDPNIMNHLSNYYTRHFCSVIGDPSENNKILDKAVEVIGEYAVVGIYEEMPEFLGELSDFLGLDPCLNLRKINVTKIRKSLEKLSPKILAKIKELNQIDLEFYERAKNFVHNRKLNIKSKKSYTKKHLIPYKPVFDRNFSIDEFKMIAARVSSDKVVNGDSLEIICDFSIATRIEILEAGIHIYDEFGRWAFGCNSNMLGCSLINTCKGTYRNIYKLKSNLPAGIYRAGFGFADIGCGKHRQLAWFDNAIAFKVLPNHTTPGVGHSSLPLQISSSQISSKFFRTNEKIYHCGQNFFSNLVGKKTHEGVVSDGREGFLLFGPYIEMPAGKYQIDFIGKISGPINNMWVDCVGRNVDAIENSTVDEFAKVTLEIYNPEFSLATLEIKLNNSVKDFQTRFYVNAEASVHLQYVVIRDLGVPENKSIGNLTQKNIDISLVKFKILNNSDFLLAAEGENPTQISCHWLDENWNMFEFDAARFPLPAGGIPPQEPCEVEIQVSPPESPGRYHLMVTLVQTIDGQTKWLHETGEFTPQIFDHKVEG